jgi:hypothetical protein
MPFIKVRNYGGLTESVPCKLEGAVDDCYKIYSGRLQFAEFIPGLLKMYVMGAASIIFGPHAGKMKLNTRNEARINMRIIALVCFSMYHVQNKYKNNNKKKIIRHANHNLV